MKPIVIIAVLVAAAALIAAVTFRSDLQDQRARADALAERVATLEPVERGQPSALPQPVSPSTSIPTELTPPELPVSVPAEQTAAIDLGRGSAYTRQHVARLQEALRSGTPLQQYQVDALLEAIDATRTPKDGAPTEKERLIQAASDILFESQMERYVELLSDGSTLPSVAPAW